jgi:hypothetical protein
MEGIVSGTPKRVIQEKTKACVHATSEVSERGIASIHLDVRSVNENVVATITVF